MELDLFPWNQGTLCRPKLNKTLRGGLLGRLRTELKIRTRPGDVPREDHTPSSR
jgi:hypothetical protein